MATLKLNDSVYQNKNLRKWKGQPQSKKMCLANILISYTERIENFIKLTGQHKTMKFNVSFTEDHMDDTHMKIYLIYFISHQRHAN